MSKFASNVCSRLPVFGLLLVLVASSGCASDDAVQKEDESAAAKGSTEDAVVENEGDGDDDDDDDDDVLAAPKTWDEVASRYEFVCPTPFFELEEPATFSMGERTLEVSGSRARFSPPFGDKIVFGVLGALKDAAPKTRKNVRRAMKKFRKAKVSVVVVNGDLAEDEGIRDVLQMLGEEVEFPTIVHAGNIEWAGAFSPAFAEVSPKFPQLFNGNWIRVFDLGTYALVTLPGYWNLKFIRSGACRYDPSQVEELLPIVKELEASGKTVVLSAHGPPKGEGRNALDLTYDKENVGDPKMAELIEDGGIRFGLFSHILESGGRAVSDIKSKRKIKRPQRRATKKLYINAGSASSYPWELLNKKTSRGMAAIVTIKGGKGKVKFLKLSKRRRRR